MKKILINLESFFKPIPILLTRLTLALVFIVSGWGKFHNLKEIISYFESLSIPFAIVLAPLVSVLELLGGIGILLGAFTRMSSLFLAVIMGVALKTAKWEEIKTFQDLIETSEFLYFILLLWLTAIGPHYLSVDVLLRKKKYK